MKSWIPVVVALASLAACKERSTSPAPACGPLTATLDDQPLAISALVGYRSDDTWTIRLFLGGAGPATCERLESTDPYVEITAFEGEPEMGIASYRLETPLAVGLTSDLGPRSRCKDGRECSELDVALVAKPAAAGDPIAMCTTSAIRLRDSDKLSHVVRIAGRLDAKHCGAKH